MKTTSARPRTIPLARRALIVQRVLVDGWTTAEAAGVFGISERQVDIWVAEFRRDGMRSLRRSSGKALPAEIIHIAISRPVRGLASRIANGLRHLFLRNPLQQSLPRQRSNDDRRSGD